jgi:hypothetical protein
MRNYDTDDVLVRRSDRSGLEICGDGRNGSEELTVGYIVRVNDELLVIQIQGKDCLEEIARSAH